MIRVRVRIEGPTGRTNLICALDTGATQSLIGVAPLVYVGYDPSIEPQRMEMTTGSGVVYVPLVRLNRLTALGETKTDFTVMGHTLPPTAHIDGLIGLDFLRDHQLNIDFLNGEVSLG